MAPSDEDSRRRAVGDQIYDGLGSAQEGPGSAQAEANRGGLGSARPRGLKGLTTRHRDAYANGTLSQADIARELGVRKQAVQKAFQKRGWTTAGASAGTEPTVPAGASRQASQMTSAGATAPPPKSAPAPTADGNTDDWLPAEQRRQLTVLIAQGGLKAVAQTIREINDGMTKNAGSIGHSALNGYMRAVRSALEIGAALLDRPDDSADMLTAFRIETMSDEDVARIKAEASANHHGLNGEDQEPVNDRPAPTENTRGIIALPLVRASPPIEDGASLPSRAELRNWLLSRADTHGRRHLRDIAEHVGLRPGMQDDNDFIVDSIIHAIDGDPRRLRRPRD